ncbi:MAG: nucleotidyltransferase, partial [Methanobacteriota archaeon]
MYETFLQGSYRTGTSVRPRNGQEFDVDVIVALSLEDENGSRMSPSEAIDMLYNILKSISIYQDRVQRKTRCVRIDYAGDFHMDVVPAHYDESTGTLYVPDRKADKWSETNPKGYIQWCSERNDEFNGKFTRVVKFLKWWRNRVFGKDCAVKSIILTTLIGKNFSSDCSTDADALLGTVSNLHDFLQWHSSVPCIPNPSLSTENLARDWKQEHYETFKNRVAALLKKIEDAYEEEDLEKSVEKWREIFGDEFPSPEEVRAQKVKAAQTEGKVL